MSRLLASVLSAALAVVVTLAAWTGEVLLVAATVVLVQVLVAAAPSPPDERGRPQVGPRFWPALAAGLVATVVAVRPAVLAGADGAAAGREGLVSTGVLAGVLPGVAVGVVLALVAQMVRRGGRPDLVVTTGHAVTLAVFTTLATGWVAASRSGSGPELVTFGAAGVAVALLVWTVPGDRVVLASAAVTAAGGAGAAAAVLVDGVPGWGLGVAVGAGAGFFAVLGQVLGRAWSKGRLHAADGWGFPGALALALPAPVVLVGAQLVGLPGL